MDYHGMIHFIEVWLPFDVCYMIFDSELSSSLTLLNCSMYQKLGGGSLGGSLSLSLFLYKDGKTVNTHVLMKNKQQTAGKYLRVYSHLWYEDMSMYYLHAYVKKRSEGQVYQLVTMATGKQWNLALEKL